MWAFQIFLFLSVSWWNYTYEANICGTWWKKKIEKTRKGLSIVVYDNEYNNDKTKSTSLSKYITKYKLKKFELEKYIHYLEIHKQENAIDILNDLNATYPIQSDYPLIWLFREKEYIGSYEKIPYYIRDISMIYNNIHYINNEEKCIQYIVSQNKYVYIYSNEYDISYIQKAIRPYFYLYTFFNLDEIKEKKIRDKLYNYLMSKYKLLYHGEIIWYFSNGFYNDYRSPNSYS